MAANDGFNGTTVTWATNDTATTTKPLIAASYDGSVAKVDVTGCDESTHTYEGGIPTEKVTWTIVGDCSLVMGAEAALVMAWADGGSYGSFTNGLIVGLDRGGGEGGPVTTTVTVVPTAA